MKVQQLVQGATPASTSSSRASRAGTADGKPSDFAGALSEARKKPDAKAPEADAPPAKKPATAKKPKPQENQSNEERQEDRATERDAVPTAAADGQVDQPAESVEGDEPVAPDEPAASDVERADEKPGLDAVVQLVAQPIVATPQDLEPTADDAADDAVTVTLSAPRLPKAVSAVPQEQRPSAETELPALAAKLTGAILGDDGVEQEAAAAPIALQDIESSLEEEARPIARAPEAPRPLNAQGAPLFDDKTHDDVVAQAEQAADDAPQTPSQVALTAETLVAADAVPAGQAGVSAAQDMTAAAPTVHVQPEIAKTQATPASPAAATPAPMPPQAHFVEANHPTIVTAIRGELLPQGGTMNLRLDPPELGALQVLVHMQDGVMTASFQTSSDDATKLLSHSLSQLKSVLESQGVSVEKLQVTQAPKEQQASNQGENRDHQRDQHDDAHRQEQQRKEMLRRMWRRLANGSDPLDLVA
jgi:flagellar hook-length control protein FliK